MGSQEKVSKVSRRDIYKMEHPVQHMLLVSAGLSAKRPEWRLKRRRAAESLAP